MTGSCPLCSVRDRLFRRARAVSRQSVRGLIVLVPEAVLLCLGGQLVEHLLPLGFVALLVRE